MEYPYFKGLEADRYSFYRVPKALVKADLFQKMSGDAKLLYAVLLDRMSLSIKNGWQDKHGNAYIICTIEEVMDSMAKKLCKLHHTAVDAAYRPQPLDWDVLLGLLHKKPPRRSSYGAQLSDSDSLVTTTQIAKEYGCGAKVFNRLLHLHGIQYRANGQWVLYSEHHGKGYTSSLTFRLQRSDGSEVEKLHTAWTQKGRKFLYHTLKRRGVLPLAEQGD